MAEMGVALAAQSFYALHEQAAIFFGTNVLLGRGGPEAGPTRARLELLQRPEQGIATTDARVQSSRMVIPVAPGERAFTGRYWNNHAAGLYAGVRCGNTLFRPLEKFEPGTG